MLPADVYARFLRARGEEVLYICATDEHGTPAELAAAEAGLDVAEYCRRQHEVQAQLSDAFGLSFDSFGRSSSPENHELTRYFGRVLDENGFIEERSTKQVYSVADGRFLPDRYIIGTCPHCGYSHARGDQCENCSRVLDPAQLIDARSAISGSTDLEVRERCHLYLRQSLFAGELRAWLESKTEWPVLARSIGIKWLDEGLEDRSITRDLSWGVAVDRPRFDDKVYYVWFDAPIEYIAATKEWAEAGGDPDAWRSWWFDAQDVRYTQFMAKDNVPFHTVGFPCTILGSGEPWKLVDFLKAVNWLTYYGGKFSTSQRVGVFMDDALKLLPADYWRYYLMATIPESDDSSFTWETFALAVNKELADTYGNFVNRALTFTAKRFGSAVPEGGVDGREERDLKVDLDLAVAAYTYELERLEFRKAMQALRSIWARGNVYFDRKQPWVTIKEDRDATAVTLRTAINLIALFSRLAAPVIPFTAMTVLESFGLEADVSWPSEFDSAALPPGHTFEPPGLLFRKISDDDVAEWRGSFGGTDAVAS